MLVLLNRRFLFPKNLMAEEANAKKRETKEKPTKMLPVPSQTTIPTHPFAAASFLLFPYVTLKFATLPWKRTGRGPAVSAPMAWCVYVRFGAKGVYSGSVEGSVVVKPSPG